VEVKEKTSLSDKAFRDGIDLSRFDFTTLVGVKIKLYASQFPGRSLDSRVTVSSTDSVTIDRGGADGLIDNLVNKQKVIVQVEYKGEKIAVSGILSRVSGGVCKIIFQDKVVPIQRRQYPRIEVRKSVRLSALPVQSFTKARLAKLRWMETSTLNLSGGGALLDMSSFLEEPTYLFIHVDFEEVSFPKLIMGQVRHCHQDLPGHYHVGVKFISQEQRRNHFSSSIEKQLPEQVFKYDTIQGSLLTKKIRAWKQEQ